jgi:3-oxoacyl-[acyl-carrier protein] reductase
MYSLKGKVALVSGAGSQGGIGFAIAKSLVDLGAEVWITSTTERIYERAKAIGANGFIADLTDLEQCHSLVGSLSSLDILVNNAGMTSIGNPLSKEESASLTDVSTEAWERGIKRNLDTAFNLTKAALPKLRESHAGRIVMISSVTGGAMAMRNQPVYATAKAALLGLTKSIALDEASYGITCNAILPGWIETDTQSEHEKLQGLKVPLGRNGKPSEIAGLVAWLATESAGYITGQSIIVDGGNSLLEERA